MTTEQADMHTEKKDSPEVAAEMEDDVLGGQLAATKGLPKPAKIVIVIAVILVCLVLLVVVGFNIYMRTTYSSFFDDAKQEFKLPGIDSGFIPQDLDFYDQDSVWLVSGYMSDDGASPLYKRTSDGTIDKINLKDEEGSDYTGHGSAVTSTEDNVFITCEYGYLVFSAEDIISAQNGDTVTAIDKVSLDFSPAFMNIEQDGLLLGNFYHPGAYETPDEHTIATVDESDNNAVLYVYPSNLDAEYGFSRIPDRVYSIPDRVQGVCATDDGKLIFSSSYGFNPSHILIFDVTELESEGVFLADGSNVPLYVLDSRSQLEDIVAPPMTEGIETHEDRIFISEESATNKYIFGKLYGAGYVYSIDLDDHLHG